MSDPEKQCSGTDCNNKAGTLQCPTCLKLGLKGSYFCDQDCFKRNWVGYIRVDIFLTKKSNIDRIQTTHKVMHKTQNGTTSSRWHAPVTHGFVL